MIQSLLSIPGFSSIRRLLLIGCVLLFPYLLPAEQTVTSSDFLEDSLIYGSREEALEIWTATEGTDSHSILEPTTKGLSLNDLSGDCYEGINNQKAVFLKKPPVSDHYWFQAEIDEFLPVSKYAQCGLAAWNDQDNYIRHTIGFKTAAREALSEINGRVNSKGLFYIYPRTNPVRTFLKMEVLEHTVRTYASYDGKYWFINGGFALPEGISSKDFVKGIGILGVGGDMAEKPVFSNWKEGTPGLYRNDDFSGEFPGSQWMTGQTNSGWGSEEARIEQKNGNLVIHPYSGSDIYLRNENYPFEAMPSPRKDAWQMEVGIRDFDPHAPGKWNKGGVVLWRGNDHCLVLSLVKDEDNDQVYFESLALGGKKDFSNTVRMDGFAARKKTDAFFRISKKKNDHYFLEASYDGKKWFDLGNGRIPLDAPQIRLFASGDIDRQYPDDYDFSVKFDYIRTVDDQEK